MITIEKLTASYAKNIVLENLDWKVETGSIHGLVGLNGSGKTTMLNCICKLHGEFTGNIIIDNQPANPYSIAFLETVNYFYSRTTGREYLKFFKLQNKKFNIEEWNRIFNLPLDKLIETYSTGMKKKLAILGILALNRQFYMLDEPFNGVDLETTQNIKLIINNLKQNGNTIIITSHILESLTSLCDKISILENKKIDTTIGKNDFTNLEHFIFGEMQDKNSEIIHRLLT